MSAGDRDTLTDEERAALVKALAHTPCTYGDLCNEPKLEEVVTSIVAARVRAAQAQASLEKHNLPNPYLDAGDEFQNPKD